jgi:hypothetical protein
MSRKLTRQQTKKTLELCRYCPFDLTPLSFIVIIMYSIILSMLSSVIFKKILSGIAHNVPAVCDVFAARIRALRSKDQGCKNVGEVSRGRRSRPRRTEPWSAQRARNAYRPVMCSTARILFFHLYIFV